jgi:predicted DNA-binding transcriptional regulator AlpA
MLQLLSDKDVAQLTGRARSTLQKDRVAGTGIPFIRLGGLVRYRAADVEAYLAALPTLHSTSDADVRNAALAD